MSDEPEILYVSKGLNIIGWQLSLSLWGMSLMWFYAFVSGIINKQPLGYEFYVFTPIMAAAFLIGLYMITIVRKLYCEKGGRPARVKVLNPTLRTT